VIIPFAFVRIFNAGCLFQEDSLHLWREKSLLPVPETLCAFAPNPRFPLRLKGKGITFHTLKIYRCVLKIPTDTGSDIVIKMLQKNAWAHTPPEYELLRFVIFPECVVAAFIAMEAHLAKRIAVLCKGSSFFACKRRGGPGRFKADLKRRIRKL
jgi:hypothetical protein